ncbi:MAG: adenylate/guanylate cyclase domain-containing protein [Acidimicrobiales bacterium]
MARYRRRRPKSVREVLDGLGFDPETIEEAEETGTAELLAIDGLVLPERGKLTLAELADKVGAEPAAVRVLWRSLGFVEPVEDDPMFTKTDVRILRNLIGLTKAGAVRPAVALQLGRVLGQAMSQVATAVVDATEAQAAEARDSDDEAESPFAASAGEILPFLSDAVDYTFRRHLRAAARRRVDLAMLVEGTGQVVGFADLVRFTELSMQLADDELAEVVGRFDDLVHQVVVEHDGRIVKMIGDAAMFTVVDPVQGAMIALEMAEAVAAEDALGSVRIGMAYGPILTRDGDLYGPVVNLASRLVGVGRAGAVNVSHELRDAIGSDHRFALRSLGPKPLKGIGDARVYRLRPGEDWGLDLRTSAPAAAAEIADQLHHP